MTEYSSLFVVCMGMGVVFFGLISIILLTMGMGSLLQPRPSKGSFHRLNETEEIIFDASSGTDEHHRIWPEIAAILTAVLLEETGMSREDLHLVDIRRL